MTSIDIELPAAQLEGSEATLSQWLVAEGEIVSKDQPIAELETDKVAIEVVAPQAGTITKLIAQLGEKIDSGGLLAAMAPVASANSVAVSVPVTPPAGTAINVDQKHSIKSSIPAVVPDLNNSCRHLMGPVVRKLIAEHNLNIDLIVGSGRGGRISREDVLAAIDAGLCAPLEVYDDRVATLAPGASRLVPHSSMRKAIANHMVESLLEKAPHVTSIFEMDMSNIIAHRQWHKKEFLAAEVKLTFTAYFLQACVKAMAVVPEMNAQFHQESLEIFTALNIGVGTALAGSGLVVPVVKDVAALSLLDTAKALQDQTQRARNNKLTPADMRGGTFTISNHGVSGSLMAAPIIINQPQVAILGVGKMEKRVEVVEVNGEDQMRIRPKCYVSLSIDHRAVDAHQTNAWLSAFVAEIESWGELSTARL